ncbi:eukaryotic translation initiation factor 4 gamma 1-like isoform X1 [Mercenaria mercenaria]|uniref:eukaryotic translation initiation factor 4 gamma 1-like isoform X1 n=1 Tax=Mercenaria mercenaria TaxID=6596 RepID=UPI00234F9831|nr:eukaryotic translation initiation factor 4 gamma 1-like isoform X1 [Mercenaria mercenaria]
MTFTGKNEDVTILHKQIRDTKRRIIIRGFVSRKEYAEENYDGLKGVYADLYRKTQRILDRLTEHTFRTMLTKMQELPIDTETKLNGVIDIIYEKALNDRKRCVAYANLCRGMAMLKVPSDSKSGEFVNFRAVLLDRCQKEFSKNRPALKSGTKMAEDGEVENTWRRQLDDREVKDRQQSLGNIWFSGELFKLKMLTEKIIHDSVFKLLCNRHPDDLECACTLLAIIGKELDVDKAKPRMDQYFKHMASLVNRETTPAYVKMLLHGVIDLRRNKWAPCCDESPKPNTSSARK